MTREVPRKKALEGKMIYHTEEHDGSGREKLVLMIPDWSSINLDDIVARVRQLCRELVLFAENSDKEKPTFERLVTQYEDFEDQISQLSEPLDNLYASMRTPAVVVAHTAVAQEVAQCYRSVWLNKNFFRAHNSFRHTHAYRALGKEEKTAFDLQLQSFKMYGILLSDARRAQIRKIEEEIEALEQRFGENLGQSLRIPAYVALSPQELAGIPAFMMPPQSVPPDTATPPQIPLYPKGASRVTILRFTESRPIREAVYKAFVCAASDIGAGGAELDNRHIAERILQLRHRLARLYGKKNHAEHVIEGMMAEKPKNVMRFLTTIQGKIVPYARQEIARLKGFAKSELKYDKLEPWDVEYAKYRFLKKQFGYTTIDLEEYLYFPRVLQTLFGLAEKMYGIKIKERKDVRGWLPHVRFFEVYEHGGSLAGGFYLDPYARTGDLIKDESLWTKALLTRRKIGHQKIRLPLVAIHLNMPVTDSGDARHLSHEEVIGLFHEFGHMLQEVLIKSHFLATSPATIEWDVIEVPSMLMENWAWDIETLAEMTWNKKTRKSAPLALLLAVHRQRTTMNCYGRWSLIEYLERSLIDLALHSRKPGIDFIGRTVRRIRREIGVHLVSPLDRFPNNFPYIFGGGYSASYYGYLWSWRFGSAIRIEHLKTGSSVNPIVGRRFRREFLEASRTRAAKENLTAFFGRKLPSALSLLGYNRYV